MLISQLCSFISEIDLFLLLWLNIVPLIAYGLRVPAHRLRNFLLMVAMDEYYYCILTGASPLLHKDKVPAEGAAH